MQRSKKYQLDSAKKKKFSKEVPIGIIKKKKKEVPIEKYKHL